MQKVTVNTLKGRICCKQSVCMCVYNILAKRRGNNNRYNNNYDNDSKP